MFKTGYRIVRDSYSGYEAQYKPWWCPWWRQCFGSNTRGTVEGAERVIKAHASVVVKYVDPNEVNNG